MCVPEIVNPHQCVPIAADELARLHASNAEMRAALHGLLMHVALTGGEIGPNDVPCIAARAAIKAAP